MAAEAPSRPRTRPASAAAEIPNAFIGRTAAPEDADLQKALGSAKPAWDQLISGLAARHGVTTQEWRSYSLKAGWAMRLNRGKRTVVWLSPCEGCFHVGFILGDKALQAAREMRLSAPVRKALDSAVRYPEGNGIRLTVTKSELLPGIGKLAAAKIAS
jgi:hypothetical protein